jgi:hypothetical protein
MRMLRCSVIRIFLVVISSSAGSPFAHATEFPAYGGAGDHGGEIRCPPDQVMVGIRGRTGWWIDQVAPVCAPIKRPAFTIGAKVSLPPVGGGGGTPNEQYCQQNAAIRAIEIQVLFANYTAKYVSVLRGTCMRPADGSVADAVTFSGSYEFGAGSYDWKNHSQKCPFGEYATGLNLRYGKHVNAVGLICSDISNPPPR